MSKKSIFARSLPQLSTIQHLDQPAHQPFHSRASLFHFNLQLSKQSFQNILLLTLFIIILTNWITIQCIDTFLSHKDNPNNFFHQVIILCLLITSFALAWLGLTRIAKESKRQRKATLILSAICFFSTVFLTRLLFAHRAFVTNKASDWCSIAFTFMINTVTNLLLSHLIFQQWYLKLLPSLGNPFALIVAYVTADDENITFDWLSAIVGVMTIVALAIVQLKVIKKGKKETVDDKIWKDNYSLMLNQIPSAVAIIGSDDKVIYNNTEYEKLNTRYENNLLEKIISVESVGPDIPEMLSFSRFSPKGDQTESHINLVRHFVDDNEGMCSDFEISKSPTSPLSISESKSLLKAIQIIRAAGDDHDKPFAFKGKLADPESLYPSLLIDIKITKIQNRNELTLILSETASRDLLIPLENANEYKDKLLATISHEMRTPLNGNLSLIETAMNDKDMPPYIKEKLLTPAYQSGKLLWHLINDFLDVAQIKARKLRLSNEHLPLRTTLENCCKLVQVKAQTKGVALLMDLSPDVPCYFTTDHNRLSQIILNLLSNALKFTFAGEVKLQVNSIAPSLLEFVVTDTGIGMSPEDLEKLFRHFTRIDYGKRKNINTTGVGLGLSIANNLVKMLGAPGSRGISVKSIPDQGSTFSFVLKEAKLEEEEEAKESPDTKDQSFKQIRFNNFQSTNVLDNAYATQEGCTEERYDSAASNRPYESPSPKNKRKLGHNLNLIDRRFKALLKDSSENWKKSQNLKKNKTVLVVDDEPFNIMALEVILKSFGLAVEGAYHGKEALQKIMHREAAQQEGYQIVFMDCQMPVMAGYETAEELQKLFKEKKVKEVPIIGCSGFQNKEHQMKSLNCGMKEAIVKPVTKEKIKEVLKKYLKDFDA